MAYRTNELDQQTIAIVDASGSDTTTANRFPVDAKLTDDDISTLTGSIESFAGRDFSVSYVKWPNVPVTFGHSSFVDVYVLSGSFPATFLESIFQLNSKKIDVRVLVDGVTCLDLDFEELKDDFKLSLDVGLGDTRACCARFGVEEYSSKRWRFAPLVPITAKTEFKIQMKSHSGNKMVVRGISVLRTTVS